MSNSLRPHGHQAPPSMGFSRQEYWSGCHFLLQGIFPTQGLNPGLPHWTDVLLSVPSRKSWVTSIASQVAQQWRLHLPMQMWVQSLGREDSLEKAIATHSSILAWRIPWKEEPGGLQSMGSQRVRPEWATEHRQHTEPLLGSYSLT